MAVFQFSALSDGQSIAFNPNADVLNFDQTAIAAAALRVTAVGSNIRIDVASGPQMGKDVTLQNVSPLQLATTNVTFADGSRLLFGDNSTAQNDNLANSLTGTAGGDLLQGFGGADTMNGGAGNDTYVVSTGDVVSDSGGIDTVVTDVSWTLSADFENVEMIGTGNISATGNNLANRAIGNSGDNYFNMRAGNDTIFGGDGNDWIDMSAFGTASYGDDVIQGGAGTDTVNFAIAAGQQSAITVDLTTGQLHGGGQGGAGSASIAGVEHVIGAAFNDSIRGSGFAETLEGREGNDTLSGMFGNDTLLGGAGQDTFVFAAPWSGINVDLVGDFVSGTDKLAFDNSIFTGLGAAGGFTVGDGRFAAGAGFTSGRDASDRLIYNTSTGQLFYDADGSGGTAAQLIATLQGNPALAATDIAVIAQATPPLQGTSGNDSLNGTPGNDSISGLGGNDTIQGLGGDDTLDGGDGDDFLIGSDGDDSLVGGAGNDFVRGDDGNNRIVAGDGDDSIQAGKGSDFVDAGAGSDTINPNDLTAFNGDDTIDGGAGIDVLATAARSDITINLAAGTMDGGYIPTTGAAVTHSTLANIEWVIGGGGNDQISGSSAANLLDGDGGDDRLAGGDGDDTLYGGFGADTVSGGAGNDSVFGGDSSGFEDANRGDNVLAGGAGNDTLTGDSGRDVFVFSEAPGSANADTIAGGFVSDLDAIRLDSAFHPNLGPSGQFTANDARFAAGAGFTSGRDATDRVIYDTATGKLYYDADGSGAGAAQLIATLEGAPAVKATDINVDFVSPTIIKQGTDGNDSMRGAGGNDSLSGLGGNDTLDGFGGDDTLDGGAGNDSLTGGVGADSMRGGDGDDTLDGASGADHFSTGGAESSEGAGDTLDGGLGNDVYILQVNDVAVDPGGVDTILVNQFDYTLGAGFENLSFQSFSSFFDGEGVVIHYNGNELDNVIHSAGAGPHFGSHDTLDGGAGNDTLFGGGGNTTFSFTLAPDDYGHDELHGGGGVNNIDLSGARSAIVADLQAGTLTGGGVGGAGSATLDDIHGVSGGAFADHIVGNALTLPREEFFIFGLHGGGGNDTIESAVGATDDLFGDAGNDRLVARGPNDHLEGGTGSDQFVFATAPGDNPNDSDRAMVLDFASGADKIVLDGAFHPGVGVSGNFSAGDERFFAAAGATGGHDATDRVVYNTSSGELFFDADGSGGGQAQLIAVLANAPALSATDIAVENGAAPGQTINGTAGNDSLVGTAGDDTLNGLAGNDTLRGLAGNDILDGGTGVDSLDGGLGNDTYIVTAGDVLVDAGGVDGVITDTNWTLGADFENLSMTGTAALSATGNNGNNVLVGNSGNNYFNARAGNDTIQAGAGDDWIDMSAFGTASYGDDVIDGGAGFDTVNFAIASGQQSGITVQLFNQGEITGGGQGGAGSAHLTSVERVIATSFGDWLFGSFGSDTFDGREGNDTIWGSSGNDTLTGGAGQDSFNFAEAPDATTVDLITDFVSGTDKIGIDNSVTAFNSIGPDGNFAAGDQRFFAGAGATSGHDASDRVVYNTTTGQLFYDSDGNGAGTAHLIATFQGAPAIAATDITVL